MKKLVLSVLALFMMFQVSQAQAIQKVMIEEFTGAWCGFCPEGQWIIEEMMPTRPNLIPIGVHSSDAMANTTGSVLSSFFSPNYPQAVINRSGAPISRSQWENAVDAALGATAIVSVSFDSVVFDPNSRVITTKLKATFHQNASGSFRFNVFMVTPEMIGSGSGWDQVNYFNGTAGHPFQGAGDPIPNYAHKHVLRGGFELAWGKAGSIPSSVTAAGEYTYVLQEYLPPSITANDLHLVAYVSDIQGQMEYQRPILNSEEMPLSLAISNEEPLMADANKMEIYPNPSSGNVNIGFTVAEMGKIRVDVLNQMGQRVMTLTEGLTNAGAHSVNWDGRAGIGGAPVANGVYMIRMVSEHGQSLTKRLILNR